MGLTLAADGKSAGLPFAVLGGDRGGIEVAPTAGHQVAQVVVESGLSVVVDVSSFRT